MGRQVIVSDRVRELLHGSGDTLEQALRQQLHCNDCGVPLSKREPAAVSVELYATSGPDAPQNLRVFFTHLTCAPSQVRSSQRTLQAVADLMDSTAAARSTG